MVVTPRGLTVKLQTPGSGGWCADPGQPAPRLTAQLTSNRHQPVTGHPVSGTYRRAQCPQTRVSLIFECRGLRLWHHGSAHRGVHSDTSQAIVSLPSHEVMVCETSSDGPPH